MYHKIAYSDSQNFRKGGHKIYKRCINHLLKVATTFASSGHKICKGIIKGGHKIWLNWPQNVSWMPQNKIGCA